MYKIVDLFVLGLKTDSLILKLVPLLTLLSNTLTPHLNSNVGLNSNIKMVAHIIKHSTDAKVHLFGTSPYKIAQKMHNGLCKNIFPDLIVVPSSTQDVSKIVKITRRHDTSISIRSGGHSYICSSIKQGRFCFLNCIFLLIV